MDLSKISTRDQEEELRKRKGGISHHTLVEIEDILKANIGPQVKTVRYLGRKNGKKERPFLKVGKVYEVFGELIDIEIPGEIRFFRILHNIEHKGAKNVVVTYVYRRSEFEVFEYGVPEVPVE